jgi:hypothetical protein
VKNPLEVILTTIHVGSARRVVTLGLDGKDLAADFLTKLARSNRPGFQMLQARVKAVAEHEKFENQLTFRHVGDGLYEFKRPGLRLYAFYDQLPGLKPQLIIATNGGTKNTKKDQDSDIARAQAQKRRYELAKEVPGVKIRLNVLKNEN